MTKGALGNRSLYYGWVIVAMSFIMYAVAFSIPFSFGIFFKPLQDSFGWSRATVSWAMTIQQIVFAAFLIPAGWVLDHSDVRVVFSAAAVIVGASLALCSRVTEPWQLWLLWGVPLGIGLSVGGPQLMGIVTRWFEEKRGLALGIASCGVGFGALIGAPITSWLISSYGWQNAFLVLGIGSCVLTLASGNFMRRLPQSGGNGKGTPALQPGVGKRPAPAGLTFGQAIRTRDLFLLATAQAGMMFTLKVVQVHIAAYATDVGIAAATAALLVAAIGGLSIAGRLAMGFTQDSWGARRSLMLCLGVQGLSLAALPFIRSELAFFVFAVVFGFVYGGDVPQVAGLIAQRFGLVSIGVIYGLISGVGNLAGGLGPIFAGYAFDVTGSYTPVFLAAAAGLFVCTLCTWKLRVP